MSANGTQNGTGSRAAPGPRAAPSTWPRAERPLRIALIGWARLSSQVREGSGYNLSCSELARGLALMGHEVSYLASGMAYRLWPRGPHVRPREQWGGVKCWEVRNAPVIAPAAVNFGHLREECRSPATTALVLDWLGQVRAEVVHIHSIEGYGLDLIGAIRERGGGGGGGGGIPVVVTPHNYHFICPQVDLLRHEREVCTDYNGGRACAGCLPGRDVGGQQTARRVGQTLEYLLGLYPADVIRKASFGVRPLLSALARGRLLRRYQPAKLNPESLAEPELALGFDVEHTPAADGLIRHDLAPEPGEQRPRDYARSAIDTNETVLANRDLHLRVVNEFGERRRSGVSALAAASLVIPPSDYLRKVHVAMGVPEERTRWVRLGQPHFDQINRKTRRSPFYAVRPWTPTTATAPLRLAFLGTTRPNKGLEVLARAIPLLSQEVRRRCHFLIRAGGGGGGDRAFRKRLSLYPEVSVYGPYDEFLLISSGGEYDVGILSHIWLENSPLVLLENLHAGKFVVCPRLGGPVDWLTEGVNGTFFPGGDEAAMAERIRQLVEGEIAIPSAKEIHESSVLRSYPDHIREVSAIYSEVLGHGSPGGSGGVGVGDVGVTVKARQGAAALAT